MAKRNIHSLDGIFVITDAPLEVLLAIGVESHRLSFMLKKRRFVF